jgi:hypothetical protein
MGETPKCGDILLSCRDTNVAPQRVPERTARFRGSVRLAWGGARSRPFPCRIVRVNRGLAPICAADNPWPNPF